jgi:hypothetical protein
MVVKPPCSCSRCAKRKARIAPGPISYFERFVVQLSAHYQRHVLRWAAAMKPRWMAAVRR